MPDRPVPTTGGWKRIHLIVGDAAAEATHPETEAKIQLVAFGYERGGRSSGRMARRW